MDRILDKALEDRLRNRGVKPLAREAVNTLAGYIEANLDGDLSITVLAQIADYSPSYLTSAFKLATGLNLHKYVVGRRVARAKLYLGSSDATLKEIAEMVGFRSSDRLCEVFRKGGHKTPASYRAGAEG